KREFLSRLSWPSSSTPMRPFGERVQELLRMNSCCGSERSGVLQSAWHGLASMPPLGPTSRPDYCCYLSHSCVRSFAELMAQEERGEPAMECESASGAGWSAA